jgi:SAM-dependent methyltransferase
MVISNPRTAGDTQKIAVRPVELTGTLQYQITMYRGKQVFHENVGKAEVLQRVPNWLCEFKQLQLIHSDETVTALVSRKGKVTVSRKRMKTAVPVNLNHNRQKQYILEEGQAVPFLVDLGVMTPEGAVVRKRYDKFRQLNRFLEMVRDVESSLPDDRPVTIIDFGCGKSYLTFAMYYYLHERCKRDVDMLGLDLKEDVIAHCNRLAKRYGYEHLHFLTGDIKDYEGVTSVDMVVTLHACDTATDYALYKAVGWGAKVILSVPCCQHECNAQVANETLAPMLSYGIVKERFAALATDAMRAQLLEQVGYDTQILEFIDMENTPKNLLIRAVRRVGSRHEDTPLPIRLTPEYETFRSALCEPLTLERLLREGAK